MRRLYFLLVMLLLAIISGLMLPLFGQNQTIITVAAPSFYETAIQAAIADFEADNPDVKVLYVEANPNWPDAAEDFAGHLDGVSNYAGVADVLFFAGFDLTPAATRAGYVLDLSPLAQNDPALNTNDFYPAMWGSFQWDRGVWALPVSGEVEVAIYDRAAFDAAGLFYPDEFWTLDDYEFAANELAQFDDQGQIAVPGAELNNRDLLFRALYAQPFYDPATSPSQPLFGTPAMADLAERWLAVFETGILGPFIGLDYDTVDVPLRLGTLAELSENGIVTGAADGQEFTGALLPGGIAGLEAIGFAISAGTDQPEIAYALARYMTTSVDVSNLIFTQTPARRSLQGQQAEGGLFSGFTLSYSPENQAFVDLALESALPSSELRFADYLNAAITDVTAGLASPVESLDDAERRAITDLQEADDRFFNADPVVVATPIPTPVLAAGEVSLRFGLNLFSQDIPNQAEWDRMVSEFVAQNPTVGNIELIPPSFGIGLGDNPALEYDCYYEPFNSVPNVDLATLLSFDPFMDADPGFDRNDFVGDTMQQVMRENRTWGYPIVIQPEVLWYDSLAFQNAGLPSPDGGWTVASFAESLDFLTFVMENPDAPIFVPETFDNTYILMLVAAYGGIPYDYRQNPPTVALTNPVNLEAITQVLDLARDGHIGYQQLGFEGGGPGAGGGGPTFEGLAPIFTDTLNAFNFRLNQRSENPELEFYRLTNYPQGSDYVPLSFTIGTAYITAEAQDPAACYEWIDFIAQRPDLFNGLPARMSQINDPTLAAAQGEDIVTLYNDYVDLIENPAAIVFPSQFTGGDIAIGPLLESLWINRAFDNYVLDNGDLAADLSEAELFIDAYRQCTVDIPPFDIREITNLSDALVSLRDYADCAVRVDPALEPLFGPILGFGG